MVLQEAIGGGMMLIGLIFVVILILVPVLSVFCYKWIKKLGKRTDDQQVIHPWTNFMYVLLAIVVALLCTTAILYVLLFLLFRNFSYS